MKVILLEDVVGKGKAGDVVKVNDGYARNFLIPRDIAIPANETNMKNLEHRRVKLAEQRARNIEEAQGVKDRLHGLTVLMKAASADAGRLFGSITSQDIADALEEQHHITIDKKKILLAAHIKETGAHSVDIRLFPEVIATITVSVETEGGAAKAAAAEEAAPEDSVAEDTEAAEEAADDFEAAEGSADDEAVEAYMEDDFEDDLAEFDEK